MINTNEQINALIRDRFNIEFGILEEKKRSVLIDSKRATILDFLRIVYNVKQQTHNYTEKDMDDKITELVRSYSGSYQFETYTTDDKESDFLKKEKISDKNIHIVCSFLSFPIIFDTKKEIFTILSKGYMPTALQTDFYNQYFIYPINYRVERVFRNYQTDHNDLLVYTCMIRNKDDKAVLEIYDGRKLLVSGNKTIWKDFCALFKINIRNVRLEDFFALSNKQVLSMIEEGMDFSSYQNYIPLKERK